MENILPDFDSQNKFLGIIFGFLYSIKLYNSFVDCTVYKYICTYTNNQNSLTRIYSKT